MSNVKLQTVKAYIKQERIAGRFPEIIITGHKGLFYFVDRDYKVLTGVKDFETRDQAMSIRSKLLDKNWVK